GAPHHLAGGATRRQRLLAVVVVTLVAVLGTGLRAAHAAAYLPWEHHWDEITNVGVGERMSADLSPDPGFYDYPALIFLAQAAVLVPAAQPGGYDPDTEPLMDVQSQGNAHVDEPGLLLAMRWVAGVLPGIVTIGAAGAIAWTVTRRWWAAGMAALLAAISAVDLRFGVFVTPDALSGAFATLAVLGAVAVVQRPTRRSYVLTGLAIGLAAAAKYNAAVVAVALVVAHVITHRRPLADRRPLLEAAAAAAVAFAVVNLGAVLHPQRFVREIGSEGFHYSNGHFGNEGHSPLFNASWLWQSFGLGLVLLALAALLARTDRVRHAALVIAGFAGGYYLFLSVFPVRFARNLLPMTGTVAAGAAIGLVVVGERLAGRWSRPAAVAVPMAALALAVLSLPVASAAAAMRSIEQDPWSEVRDWLDDNVPEGTAVAVEARAPYVDPDRYRIVPTIALGNHDLAWYQLLGVGRFVAVSEMYQPYLDSPDEHPDGTTLYRQVLDDRCVDFEADGADLHIVVARVPPC
ncbi:MAG TPA: glycosyltransferase family 39 protein, partial [Acidimicrobiales bacterium]